MATFSIEAFLAGLASDPPPVCTISEAGIYQPPYADVLAWYQRQYRGVYGEDVYLEPDSQDGQWTAIQALAFHTANSMAVATYQSFSPATAKGAGLSINVKLNGLSRGVPTRSTVDVVLVGQAGTTIVSGAVGDEAGIAWDLPELVVIPPAGEITVTAQARDLGAVLAPPGTVTVIKTPTRGWQSVDNPGAAVAGEPVETDAGLRRRQAISTALPSVTVLEGIIGAVASVPGVIRYAAYENDTDFVDANGLPRHSIAIVVEGGDAQAIAEAIAAKKTPGSGTYGTTHRSVIDDFGIAHRISFLRPANVAIDVEITLRARSGYTAAIEAQIKSAVAAWLNALPIGEDVIHSRLFLPANLNGGTGSNTFEIVSIRLRRGSASYAPSDVTIAFNEAATADAIAVTIT